MEGELLGICHVPGAEFGISNAFIGSLQKPMKSVLLFIPILQMKKLFSLSKAVVSRTPQVHQDSQRAAVLSYTARNGRNNC